jgi:pimeloyl-ACP methyl ester carboxylesterase
MQILFTRENALSACIYELHHQLDISTIESPAVVLWGRIDTTTPLAQGQKMARLLPHSNLHVFDEWAHAPYITHPNELADALIRATEEEIA